MSVQKLEEILLSIDQKIDEYQVQYVNGVTEVAKSIQDLQEIRFTLAKYYKRYL